MANSILGRVANLQPAVPQQVAPGRSNNSMQLMQQFQQFRNTFKGNPQQTVQQMLQSGQINNAQLQQAMQMAQQFRQFVK